MIYHDYTDTASDHWGLPAQKCDNTCSMWSWSFCMHRGMIYHDYTDTVSDHWGLPAQKCDNTCSMWSWSFACTEGWSTVIILIQHLIAEVCLHRNVIIHAVCYHGVLHAQRMIYHDYTDAVSDHWGLPAQKCDNTCSMWSWSFVCTEGWSTVIILIQRLITEVCLHRNVIIHAVCYHGVLRAQMDDLQWLYWYSVWSLRFACTGRWDTIIPQEGGPAVSADCSLQWCGSCRSCLDHCFLQCVAFHVLLAANASCWSPVFSIM